MDLLTISLLRLVSGAYKYEHLTSLIVTLVINDTIFHETWLIEHKTTEGADRSSEAGSSCVSVRGLSHSRNCQHPPFKFHTLTLKSSQAHPSRKFGCLNEVCGVLVGLESHL